MNFLVFCLVSTVFAYEEINTLLNRTRSLSHLSLENEWKKMCGTDQLVSSTLRPRRDLSPSAPQEYVSNPTQGSRYYTSRNVNLPSDFPESIISRDNMLTVGLLMVLNNTSIANIQAFDWTVAELQLYKYVTFPYKAATSLSQDMLKQVKSRYLFLKFGSTQSTFNSNRHGEGSFEEVLFREKIISPYDLYLVSLLFPRSLVIFDRCFFTVKAMATKKDDLLASDFNDWNQVKRALSFANLTSIEFRKFILPVSDIVPTVQAELPTFLAYYDKIPSLFRSNYSRDHHRYDRFVNSGYMAANNVQNYIENYLGQIIKRSLQTCPNYVSFLNINEPLDCLVIENGLFCDNYVTKHIIFQNFHLPTENYFYYLTRMFKCSTHPKVSTLSFFNCSYYWVDSTRSYIPISTVQILNSLFKETNSNDPAFLFCHKVFPNAILTFSEEHFKKALYKDDDDDVRLF